MVICLGKILIRNHEVALFEQFFFSQNCMYMSNVIVSALVHESWTFLVPECLVPIFALCTSDFGIVRDDYEKKVIEYASLKSSKTINVMQVQDTLMI